MRFFKKVAFVALAASVCAAASVALAVGLPPISPITEPAPGPAPVRTLPTFYMTLGNGVKIPMTCDDPTAFNLRFSGQANGPNNWVYQGAIMPGAISQLPNGNHTVSDLVALTCTQTTADETTVEWYYYAGPPVPADALDSVGYSLPDISQPPVVRGLPVNALVGLN